MSKPRYTVTTPIYYATDEPHIGHAYCTIAADVAARYRRMTGHDVLFLTGTDEHGQKMEREAERRGITPQALLDETVPKYRELWRKLAISHDDFVRTTEPRHRDTVLEMWRRMEAKGDVYRGSYEGKYCIGCESYYLDKELVEGRCPVHGTAPDVVREEGWFFRLSAYEGPLLEHYEKHPDFIAPESRRNEVMSFVRSGLKDLSVSRASTDWGIPVPGDPTRVIYVWVDALSNYLTGSGFLTDPAKLERFWPADVHLCGKEISRFHAVYWPAFLLSAGLPLPRQVFAHGWWLQDEKKISKSSGGSIKPLPLIEKFGPDAVRYFLLREVPFGNDGSFSDQGFVQRYNADLANDFGNLAQRTLQVVFRYGGGVIPEGAALAPDPLRELCARAVAAYRASFDSLAFSRGLDAVWELVRAGNRFVDEKAPWALAKDPAKKDELASVLYTSAEIVRLLSVCLSPVLPEKTRALRVSLGLGDREPEAADLEFGALRGGTRIRAFEPLFPRVDEADWLKLKGGEGAASGTTAATAAGGKGRGSKEAQMSEQRSGSSGTEGAPGVSSTASSAGAEPAPTPVANAGTVAATAMTPATPTSQSGAAAPAAATGAPELLTVDEFFRADLRVARVKTAVRVEKSKKLLKLIVDLGGEERQIVAGIAEKYAPESLVGKSVVIVANLKPAKLMGVESQGMLLAANLGGVPIIATFEEDVPPGTKVK